MFKAIAWRVIMLAGSCLLLAPFQADALQDASGKVVVTVTTLEGTVHMPGMQVELRGPERTTVVARTMTDGAGQVTFPDVMPGRYVVAVSRPGFVNRESAVFTVRAGETAQVLLDTRLTFTPPDVEVRANAPSATNSVQPVSMSDMLSGNLFETAPVQGDDFRSLLPLLPGVVRDANGRLRIRGGQPTTGALQVSSASLIDPSSGDFDLDLPAQSVESVEVLANPFAAEYGRFTTSITQIRTRSGTNEWEVSTGNLVPRIRGMFRGIRGFEPRLSVRGPIRKDRLFFNQDLQFRYVATPVKSLPDEPEVDLLSLDSFSRVDAVISPRHLLGGGVIIFPRELRHVTMNTFRPEETTPDINQSGVAIGLVDRFAIWTNLVVETTLSVRKFEVDINTENTAPMIYAPASQRGGYFNDQERNVTSFQWVQAFSLAMDNWHGEHVFKFGTDVQRSSYDGESVSRPVEIRRDDGSLSERIDFAGATTQSVKGTEIAVFAQDRWRLNPRLTFEFGLRLDRDAVIEGVNWSPRGGAAFSVLPEGRGILRGGFGKFVQRTPLNIDAFTSFEPRTVARFGPGGSLLGAPLTYTHRVLDPLQTPEAYVGNLEWDQRFGRRILLKLAGLIRHSSHEYIVNPDQASRELILSSSGKSRYRELESTVRYLGGSRRDLTFSYVLASSTTDLNGYDQFYGNFRNPIIRANERGPSSADVPHRLLIRGTVGLPWQLDLAPVLEVRSGFPWSAVNEFQDFVGERNRSGRLPAVTTLDLSIARPWQFRKYRFRAGIRAYNLLGKSAHRDIQTNVASPFYGTAYNPIERSFGIVFGTQH